MSNYKGNGTYDLIELVLTIPDTKERIDLTANFVDFTVYESIWENTMSGSIAVFDTSNLRDRLLLSGNETINIQFSTMGNTNIINYKGYVYKVSPNNKITDHSAGYTIFFSSLSTIQNSRTFVQRGYNETPSNIVQDIFQTKLWTTTKILNATPTKGIERFVFGNINPFEAMSIALRNAVSSEGDSGYVFYEDNKGYKCIPLETLYRQEPKFAYVNKIMNAHEDHTQKHIENFGAIQEIEFIQEESFLDRIMDGAIGSRTVFFDLLTKNFEFHDYSIETEFDKNKSLGTSPTKRGNELNDEYTDETYLYMNSGDLALNPFKVKAKFVKQEAFKNRVRIVVYGDSSVKVGDVCTAQLPKFSSLQGDGADLVSGRFLITEVKHSLSNQQYYQTLMLQKNGYEGIDA